MTLSRALCIAALFAAAGCSTPAARFDAMAERAGLVRAVVPGNRFLHLTYTAAPAAAASDAGPVWVYIEGDGTPWIDEVVPADDPTPRTAIALPAMIEGPRAALFLGRPCYFGGANGGTRPLVDRECGAVWWTHRRFAPEVVASMVAALGRTIAERGWSRRTVNLVGFSGGGTLAVLMAPHLDRLCAVITLASPLDLVEWARVRGYTPLEGSIDPASSPPLPARVRQLHLRGALDRIVAADNGAAFRLRNPEAEFRTLPGLAHGAEWIAAWSAMLSGQEVPALGQCK